MRVDLDNVYLSPRTIARWHEQARRTAADVPQPVGEEYGVIRADGSLVVAVDCGDPPVVTVAITVPPAEWRHKDAN